MKGNIGGSDCCGGVESCCCWLGGPTFRIGFPTGGSGGGGTKN